MAAQDPSAPNWQFLQDRWTAVKRRAAGYGSSSSDSDSNGGGGGEGDAAAAAEGVTDEAASLLLVISHTTAGFPKETAEELAAELLQVI